MLIHSTSFNCWRVPNKIIVCLRTLSILQLFLLKRSLSWLFQKLTRTYITTKSHIWENFLWTIAEIVFPFRLGYLLGASLFFLGIIGLSLDLSLSGLVSTWGFGQLPPTY